MDDITSEIVEEQEEVAELDPMNFSIDEINRVQKGALPLEDEVQEEQEPLEKTEVVAEKESELTSFTLDDLRDMERMLGTSTPTALEAEKEEGIETETKDEFLDFEVKKISKEEAESKE